MNVEEQESQYRRFLLNNGHSQATLSTYPLMLKRNIPTYLKEIENDFPSSIFVIDDVEFLNNLYVRLLNGDLKEFNINTQNRAPSASIKKYIEFLESIKQTQVLTKNISIKNIILYGAPGVGKTHNYKKLIALIEGGDFLEKDIFDFVINNKDDEIEEGSIEKLYKLIKDEKRVEFVTFHQSYSYEDFIEGFRPNESGDIERKDGIFKVLADKARKNLENSQITIDEIDKVDIEELIQKFTNYVQDSLDNEKEFLIDNKITIESINDRGAFVLGGSIKSNTQRLTPDIIKRDYEDFKQDHIKSYEDVKPTYESQRSFHGNARYYFMIYKKIAEFEKTFKPETIQIQKEVRRNFYIVIDEINRGNISKIFGELITLIEEDKRDKYEITLPYSKTPPFKVPSNLYIIATMNSTDKSIATIDIALRRRFTFLKMRPNLELVSDKKAKEFMQVLNQYIAKKLGEDYMLGHSYFMGDIDLDFVKEYKIKPLLEEYFYADEKSPDEIISAAFNEVKKENKVEEDNE